MTMTYLWQQKEFYEDLQQVCNEQTVQSIRIASAKIAPNGVKGLQKAIAPLKLEKDAIEIYCSAHFSDTVPANDGVDCGHVKDH